MIDPDVLPSRIIARILGFVNSQLEKIESMPKNSTQEHAVIGEPGGAWRKVSLP
jgi:hypothetical protein